MTALHSRIEDLAFNLNYREKFDFVVSRAVAPLNTLLEYAIPFLKVGGIFLVYKSSSVNKEIDLSKNALKLLNCEIISKNSINFDEIFSNRCILCIKKLNTTSNKYPRAQNKPRKQPL